ncbi:MAG TPA: DUF1697 domain-containing protein [Acidimicrobiales bacterium]
MYVAMLRGINVGSRNRVAMSELRAVVESLGYGDVRTYVQSGNVVFSGSGRTTIVAGRLSVAVRDELGVDAPVVVRTGREMAEILRTSPFIADGLHPDDEPTAFHVTFLADVPDAGRWDAVAAGAERFAPDVCRLVGADVHLHVPGGRYSDSKLTNAYFEKKLSVTATTRNWRTVVVLAEMAAG